MAALRRRLRRLATSREADLLQRAEEAPHNAYAQRSPLALPASAAVCAAACAALAERGIPDGEMAPLSDNYEMHTWRDRVIARARRIRLKRKYAIPTLSRLPTG